MSRRRNSSNLARAHTAVIAHAIYVDRIGAGGGIYLEGDRAALIHTDVGGETLDRQISGATFTDIPLTIIIPRQTVLGNDRVRRIAALRMRLIAKAKQ